MTLALDVVQALRSVVLYAVGFLAHFEESDLASFRAFKARTMLEASPGPKEEKTALESVSVVV